MCCVRCMRSTLFPPSDTSMALAKLVASRDMNVSTVVTQSHSYTSVRDLHYKRAIGESWRSDWRTLLDCLEAQVVVQRQEEVRKGLAHRGMAVGW
jgi:hypothetical protein